LFSPRGKEGKYKWEKAKLVWGVVVLAKTVEKKKTKVRGEKAQQQVCRGGEGDLWCVCVVTKKKKNPPPTPPQKKNKTITQQGATKKPPKNQTTHRFWEGEKREPSKKK